MKINVIDDIKIKEIENGMRTAYIDSSNNSNIAYSPEFIWNDYKQGKKVLSSIEEELRNCDEFSISVAFITKGGITPLLEVLTELEKKNIPGRILTTDYLMFSDPEAIDTLASLKNIKVKMFCTDSTVGGFHTKGYIFRKEEIYRIIIGSSNMTLNAITRNKEWNTKIVATKDGEIVKDILNEFQSLWEDSHSIAYEDFIEDYKTRYKISKEQRKIAKERKVTSIEQYKLTPNKMQVAFIKNLKELRKRGVNRALLLSSTGSGKTYASAFALREEKPQKALFLVHREQIAKQAIKSYRKVFGDKVSFGLLSGNSKEYDADYLFSTMQMMSKEDTLKRFKEDEFNTIIVDEVHRAGAESYQKIMNYFKPNFWLGMTASPERTDGFDIYELFDHNIAYEIRLQQALEEDLLCPFHYFGITDLEIDGETFDDHTGLRNFSNLVCDDRVNYIIEKAKYYGYCGDRVKGLVFCSRKEEARELSIKFNARGYHTDFLCGDDSQERREEAIARLEQDEEENRLDYIFTVDIFNEGVDIPSVNQVIMLRPTESPIIFVQQLGRGLRKADNKEYVVILDFIGNYMNNFMIPIALSGDRTYNKDTIRRYVISGNNVIPGSATIHFDEVSKTRILNSVDAIKGIKTIIKQSYTNLKFRLGRVPYLMDFYAAGEVDPLLIIGNYKTYQAFLEKMEGDEQKGKITDHEKLVLEYLSKTIVSGKRPHELEILSCLLEKDEVSYGELEKILTNKYNLVIDRKSIDSAVDVLKGRFVSKEEELNKYGKIDILDNNEVSISRTRSFTEGLDHEEYLKQLNDIVQVGLNRYVDLYSNEKNKKGSFVLYEKYSRRDVCLLLNWGKDLSSTMYGMKRIEDNVCIFVTYHKVEAEDGNEYVEGKPNYADEFIDNRIFAWDSQIGRGPDSTYMKDVKGAKYKHLFVKKNDDEGNDYYYMGMFDVASVEKGTKNDKSGKPRDITKVKFRLHDLVRDDLLNYLRKNK